jgi:2-polyprenyl-3-methyl-5-hydroxy-6-metoxy-1,4-benzoquinol methylase
MATSNEVKQYYDEFSAYEVRQGVNLRHYSVFNRIIASGLRKHHHVLEIGCGIGQITGLLSSYLTRGKIVATDISPESIEVAKKRIGDARVEFMVTDMTDFSRDDLFDFVILPDVLEHIPIGQHDQLFSLLTRRMKSDAMMLIHIPHPASITFDREHRPHKLQIIDQALHPEHITALAAKQGLLLQTYEPYKLYHSTPDYIWIAFGKHPLNTYENYPNYRIIIKKQWGRAKYWWARLLG